jgi:hypothetical protein
MKRQLFIYALAIFFALVLSEGFTSFMMAQKHFAVQQTIQSGQGR